MPEDKHKRQEIIEQIEESANEKWEELDQKFFEYVDNLNLLNIEYVRQNRGDFS